MPSVLDHLQATRAAMVGDVERLTSAIKAIDDMIVREGGVVPELRAVAVRTVIPTPTIGERVAPIRQKVENFRPVREIALDFARTNGVVSLNQVVDAAHAEGNPAKYESISSVLSRLGKEGILTKGPRRGTYAYVGDPNDHDDVDFAPEIEAPEIEFEDDGFGGVVRVEREDT